jgi:hypothetical protein
MYIQTTNASIDDRSVGLHSIEHVHIRAIYGSFCLKRVARVTTACHINTVTLASQENCIRKKKKMHIVHITCGLTILNVKCINLMAN